MTYSFLQHYWWFIVSLLGALLVFLMFVQGANSLLFTLGRTKEERRLLVNSTGRKWEFTFTTLVTFGGAFFASFPLFYSTSFGGAYWLWMIILFTFVLQAVSYEFQNKVGGVLPKRFAWIENMMGTTTFQCFLVLNGLVGPLLLGGAVATFFEGSNFTVSFDNFTASQFSNGVISSWANSSHGLDALLNPWVLVLGLAVMFLARTLGSLYIINNVADVEVCRRTTKRLPWSAGPFVLLFVVYLVHLLTKDGWMADADGTVTGGVPHFYLTSLLQMWPVLLLLLVGVGLVLFGLWRTLSVEGYTRGIWFAGSGTVLAVLSLLLVAGWNGSAYYPSLVSDNMSLTISNSSSSLFTLRTMFFVSLLVPFVLAYIVYCWRKIDSRKLTINEVKTDAESY